MDNAQLVTLSRQTALLRQMDVLANNVANTSTTGFKARAVRFNEVLMQNARADAAPKNGRAVSFVIDQGAVLDFSEGSLERTNSPLDIALRGNELLAVRTSKGDRYTRNGALTINGKGQLATSDGAIVLGDGGPIIVDPSDGALSITSDGVVSSRSGPIGQLKIVEAKNPALLVNEGANLYSTKSALPVSKSPELIVGALEKSNVQPVLAMSKLIEINRTYASVVQTLQRLDDTKKSALERLSTIPN